MVNDSKRFPRTGRRRERGATVFVVVMAITLLTALGLFAAHSATMVDQAAGYERVARQTQQLAEYGTQAITAELGSGTAEAHIAALNAFEGGCYANGGRTDARCHTRSFADLNERTQELSEESLTTDASGSTPNRLGNGDVEATFKVELTDPSENARVAGNDYGSGALGSKFRYVQVTATTFAQIFPAGAGACVDGVSTLAGQQGMRAQLVVGPVQH